MNNINPALAAATQTLNAQANGITDTSAKEPKVTDKTTSETSSGGNTTVTLSEQSEAERIDYRDLAASQTINANRSVEDAPVETNQTANTATSTSFVAGLQAQANYLASQPQEDQV